MVKFGTKTIRPVNVSKLKPLTGSVAIFGEQNPVPVGEHHVGNGLFAVNGELNAPNEYGIPCIGIINLHEMRSLSIESTGAGVYAFFSKSVINVCG